MADPAERIDAYEIESLLGYFLGTLPGYLDRLTADDDARAPLNNLITAATDALRALVPHQHNVPMDIEDDIVIPETPSHRSPTPPHQAEADESREEQEAEHGRDRERPLDDLAVRGLRYPSDHPAEGEDMLNESRGPKDGSDISLVVDEVEVEVEVDIQALAATFQEGHAGGEAEGEGDNHVHHNADGAPNEVVDLTYMTDSDSESHFEFEHEPDIEDVGEPTSTHEVHLDDANWFSNYLVGQWAHPSEMTLRILAAKHFDGKRQHDDYDTCVAFAATVRPFTRPAGIQAFVRKLCGAVRITQEDIRDQHRYQRFPEPDQAWGNEGVDAQRIDEMAKAYYSLGRHNGTLFSKDARQWLEQITFAIDDLLFAGSWRSLHGPGSTKRKNDVRNGIFNSRPQTATSEQQFRNRFERVVNGQRVMAMAYQVLGPIVLFHPGLTSSMYSCEHKGPKLVKGMRAFRNIVEASAEFTAHMQTVRQSQRDALYDLLAGLDADTAEITRSLTQIDQLLERRIE